MRHRQHDVRRLMLVAEAAYRADHAKMGAIAQREARLRGQITKLNAPRHDRITDVQTTMAAQETTQFLWQGWIDRRLLDLNAELARVIVEKAQAKAALAKTFGRFQVAEKLLEQARLAKAKKLDEQ